MRACFFIIITSILMIGCTQQLSDLYAQNDSSVNDLDFMPCDYIESSIFRPYCYAIMARDISLCDRSDDSDDRDYCLASYADFYAINDSCSLVNRLNIKSDCYFNTKVSNLYSNLAYYRNDITYCSYITNISEMAECELRYNITHYSEDISICEEFEIHTASIPILGAQTVYYCYLYHIKERRDPQICAQVPDFMSEICTALIDQNISYCETHISSNKDECFADFAYYNDDITLCADAYREENCLRIIGGRFKNLSYCFEIQDQRTQHSCFSYYVLDLGPEPINYTGAYTYCLIGGSSSDLCILAAVEGQLYQDEIDI